MNDPSIQNFETPSDRVSLNPQPEPPGEPVMSTPETLTSIFFEPGRVFEALKARPRFLVATLVMIVAMLLFTGLFLNKVGYEKIVRAAIENNPRVADLPADQREQIIRQQTGPVFQALAYVGPVIAIFVILFAGAALYLLGTMMMAKSVSYKQALAVWAYSSMPPFLLAMILNIVLLFVKNLDDADLANARGGLVHANLGLLVDPKVSPALATALSSIDVFAIYGLFLAALGLRKVGKLSTGTAWTIVLIIWLLGIIVKVGFAGISGTAMG